MTNPDRDIVKAAEAALERVAAAWMARRGVVGVEVARRWRGGAPTDEVVIRVTVERKLPDDQVPDAERFPRELEGIPVDVVEGRRPSLQ